MDDDYRPPRQERAPRNRTRRERAAHARRNPRLKPPGGITAPCGCVITRAAGAWRPVWPCSPAHHFPEYLTDEHAKQLMKEE